MPAVQTTYATGIAQAVEGMIATSEPTHTRTGVVEGSAGIGFGKVAVRGTGDKQIKASAASTPFAGITILDHNIRPEVDPDKYAQYDNAAILLKGVIWVLASVDVADGDPAYFVPATGVITNVATSNTAIPGGVFESTGLATTLVKLRVNF